MRKLGGRHTVCVTANVQGVIALDALTGAERWHREGYTATSAIARAHFGGVLYFGDYDHNMYALAADSGNRIWSFTTGSFVCSTPVTSNDDATIFVGGHDSAVYALDSRTGQLKWKFAAKGMSYTAGSHITDTSATMHRSRVFVIFFSPLKVATR